EELVVDALDRARIRGGIEASARVLRRRLAEPAAKLRIVDEQSKCVRELLRARIREQEPSLSGEQYACPGLGARCDHRLAVRRRLEHRPAEPDALVRERDDAERVVDLACLSRERQERESLVETLRGDEVLDRRLLVGEKVRERERTAADRLEVLGRTDAA